MFFDYCKEAKVAAAARDVAADDAGGGGGGSNQKGNCFCCSYCLAATLVYKRTSGDE